MAKRETKVERSEAENEPNQTGVQSEVSAAEVTTGDVNDTASEGSIHDGDDGDYAIEKISVKATRDDFAIAALQGMLANGTHMQRADAVAYKAYEYADAMLDARGE